MTHVATLISHPSRPIGEVDIAVVSAALPYARACRWLAPDIAVDIPFAPLASDDKSWIAVARCALDGLPIDIVIQDEGDRRKSLLVTDMDSTLIEQECIDELADAIGLRPEVSAITLRSMRGEADFDDSLRERVALLRGLDVAMATRIVEDRISLMPGARTLIATMRAHGAKTVIASGGFTLFTSHVAMVLGIDEHHSNMLIVKDGHLDGTMREPVFGPDSKRDLLCRLRDELSLMPDQTMAVGDGANDLPMLLEAGLGVAFHAQPSVASAARARIDHGDLTALLYLQGYAQTDVRT